jgi:hypothetical protein
MDPFGREPPRGPLGPHFVVGISTLDTMIVKHNCENIVRDLSEKLRARARHVVFLLGAGASCAGNLPDLKGLKEHVKNELDGDDRGRFEKLAGSRNLEEVLTRVRLLGEALTGSDQIIDSLTAATARELDRTICAAIARIVTTTSVDITHHRRLGHWIGLSHYDRPIELVTTNYDLLIEHGLEAAGTPYFDGFIGTFAGRFRADLVEEEMAQDAVRLPTGWARVWKLHGSVSWVIEEEGGSSNITRLGTKQGAPDGKALAIYPSFQKYEESRRLPFVTLADRLRRSLAVPETLVLTTGYSFGDQHINELLFDAARFYQRSEIVALFRGDIPSDVAERAIALANLTALGAELAILGGQAGPWEPPAADTEFARDGRFLLGDFATLAAFLARRIAAGASGTTAENTP